MVLVFQAGSFWIEVINIPRLPIAAGGLLDVTSVLSKAGRFMGAATTADGAGIIPGETTLFNGTDGLFLTFGDEITSVRLTIRNDDTIAADIGVHIIILMSK